MSSGHTTRRLTFMRGVLFILFALLTVDSIGQQVVSINISESINPATEDYIKQSISVAEKENASCVLIHLNTPGGLLTSTREIVTRILNSKVPVVVYVSPSGARAGSAGVFITMAANIAAMAPGTNIGAAHPVSAQGTSDGVMNEKVVNDAAAFIRSLAEKRGRNVVWAEEAVRESVSLSETEALEKNVINLIAKNDSELLKKINGLEVETTGGKQLLNTANAKIQPIEMGFFLKVLSRISDPNIAYILMMLGFLGLVFELFNPGAILPGIVGVICLILAFYTMSSLPVNYAAIALIVFGIVLYLLEIKVTSHGMLAIGGTASVLLGSLFLFRASSVGDVASLSLTVVISTTLITFLFFLFIVGLGLKAQRQHPMSGTLVGKTGIAITDIGEEGVVKVLGETWNAVSEGEKILKGTEIRVNKTEGLTLRVLPVNADESNNQT